MYWHIDADLISLLVMAAIYFCNRLLPRQGTAIRPVRFNRCLLAGMGIALIDAAASLAMEISIPRALYHVLMSLYFIGIELLIVEWLLYSLTILYAGEIRRGHRLAAVLLTVYGLYALFVASNPWTGLIYRLGPENEYSRGPLFALMLVLFGALTAFLLVLMLLRRRHLPEGYPAGVLLLTPVMLSFGIAVQLAVPGWLMILPAYMLCMLLAFLFLQTRRVRTTQKQVDTLSVVAETDSLTGLLNRSGMELTVLRAQAEAQGQSALVLLADIDNLKGINDSLGHAGGDRAIRLVGGQLRRHFRSTDTVVRYGGDEFLVLLLGEPREDVMRESLRQLTEEIGRLSAGGAGGVPLHISIGAAYGTVGQDSFLSVCEKADRALYRVKRNGKNGFAFYEDAPAGDAVASDA